MEPDRGHLDLHYPLLPLYIMRKLSLVQKVIRKSKCFQEPLVRLGWNILTSSSPIWLPGSHSKIVSFIQSGFLALFVFLVPRDCCVALPRDSTGFVCSLRLWYFLTILTNLEMLVELD